MTPPVFPRNMTLYLGLLIILAVLGFQLAANLQLQRMFTSKTTTLTVNVSTLINYGNGTSRWHNETTVPATWNFYDLTSHIAHVEADYSPSVQGEHFVTGIDGIHSAGRFYWTLWLYCQPARSWAASPVGADLLKLANGDIFAWYFQSPPSIDTSTWQPPVQGASKTSSC